MLLMVCNLYLIYREKIMGVMTTVASLLFGFELSIL